MFVLYDLIFLIFVLIYLPIYLFKGKFHNGFSRRLGILPKNLNLDRPIWIHAVSLGEAISVRGLIEELRKVYPTKKFVISSVTPTGNKIAQETARPEDLVTYLPLDFSFIVRSVINKINPGLFIIVETEIWPNLITYLKKRQIPIITVNGRVSDASFKGYSAMKPLIKTVLNKISLFCMQTESDANKLRWLGVNDEKIRVTGNMKFDLSMPDQVNGYREKLGLNSGDKLFVAGSTHPGEEEIILNAYKAILNKFPDIKLLIAPRHSQRAEDLLKLLALEGLEAVRISNLNQTGFPGLVNPIFILDTVGELINFYAAADIVFVGGSLIKRGGHNILEPASLGKPVIFGPQMFNFRDIAAMFLENGAAILVHSEQELVTAVESLLTDSQRMVNLVSNAKQVMLNNQGATRKDIVAIRFIYRDRII